MQLDLGRAHQPVVVQLSLANQVVAAGCVELKPHLIGNVQHPVDGLQVAEHGPVAVDDAAAVAEHRAAAVWVRDVGELLQQELEGWVVYLRKTSKDLIQLAAALATARTGELQRPWPRYALPRLGRLPRPEPWRVRLQMGSLRWMEAVPVLDLTAMINQG